IWVQIGQIGDYQIRIDDIHYYAIPDHSGVGVLVSALDLIAEFIRSENGLYDVVEHKVSVVSLSTAISTNRTDHEAKRPLRVLLRDRGRDRGGIKWLLCHAEVTLIHDLGRLLPAIFDINFRDQIFWCGYSHRSSLMAPLQEAVNVRISRSQDLYPFGESLKPFLIDRR